MQITGTKYIPSCESRLFLGRKTVRKQIPLFLVSSWGSKLITYHYHHVFFSRKNLFSCTPGKITMVSWEYTPKAKGKETSETKASCSSGAMVVNLPLTSGVPMRSLKHFEVGAADKDGGMGRHASNGKDLYWYDAMEDMVFMAMDGK